MGRCSHRMLAAALCPAKCPLPVCEVHGIHARSPDAARFAATPGTPDRQPGGHARMWPAHAARLCDPASPWMDAAMNQRADMISDLSAEDKRKLLEKRLERKALEATVHAKIEAQARRTPDAIAVVSGERRRARAARRASRSSGASAPGDRCRPGVSGWPSRRAACRPGGRVARHPQGRRGLCPARSCLSGAAADDDGGGCGSGRPGHRAGASRQAGGRRQARRHAGIARGFSTAGTERAGPGSSRIAGQPGLRHLYLGLDRQAQGGVDHAPALANFLESMQSLFRMSGRDAVLSVTTVSFDIAAPRSSCRSSRGAGGDRFPPVKRRWPLAGQAAGPGRHHVHAGHALDLADAARRRLARGGGADDPLRRRSAAT